MKIGSKRNNSGHNGYLLGIVTFGVLRPLVNRIIVPIDAGRPGEPISGTDDEVDLDKVTVQEEKL